MSRTIRWLRGDLARVRVGGRALVIKRVHGIPLLAALLALLLALALGAFAGYDYAYRTLPRPPLPAGQRAPAASSAQCAGKQHVLGGCLPRPTVENQALITASRQGPDFSNNDPVSCSQMARIAAHNAFVELKVNQGTYYRDGTAAAMAACARVLGLVAGGYDFLDVCRSSPQAEAHFFYALLIADRLVGRGTLPPTGDAEYPTGRLSCNGRAWVAAWIVEIHVLSGRWPMIYTGAWWWQPHIGCWWYGALRAWISGYGVRYPFMPCGRSQLDIWQFSDQGWNGATTGDLSIWRDGTGAFARSAGAPAAARPALSRTVYRFGSQHVSERNTVRTWDRARCRNPVRRAVCRSSRARLILLAGRDYFVAHHTPDLRRTISPPRWGQSFLGWRYRQLTLRIGR